MLHHQSRSQQWNIEQYVETFQPMPIGMVQEGRMMGHERKFRRYRVLRMFGDQILWGHIMQQEVIQNVTLSVMRDMSERVAVKRVSKQDLNEFVIWMRLVIVKILR
jgi:hypothetical protein